MSTELTPWATRAVNLPEHVDNAIHTDAGARAAGYAGALVAGTSVYAYLTHPPAAAWGLEWLQSGGGELRLRRAVFHDEALECRITESDDGPAVELVGSDETKASLALWRTADAPELRDGEDFAPWEFELTEDRARYGIRAGDDLPLYDELEIAHPALWPTLANGLFKRELVTGPWIHTRSRIHHQGLARVGDEMRVESRLVDRFDSRAGERALVDIAFYANDEPVAMVEHEAVVTLVEN